MSNVKPTNELNDSPPAGGAQGPDEVDWATISIAVPRDMKDQFERLAERMRLKPSQYGRMLLAEAISRAGSAA